MTSYAEYSEIAPEFQQLMNMIPRGEYNISSLEANRQILAGIPIISNTMYPGPKDADTAETKIPVRDGTEITVRVYTPKEKREALPSIVFYFHPGGWVGGVIDHGHPHCLYLASHGAIVINVDYRFCPENAWNVPHDDGYDVYRAIHGAAVEKNTPKLEQWGIPEFDTDKVYVFGGSAGAEIAFSCATLDIENGRPGIIKGVLVDAMPACDDHLFPAEKIAGDHSYIQNKNAPFVNSVHVHYFTKWRNSPPEADKYFSPLVALSDEVLKQFPMTYGTAYGMDILRDTQMLLFERMKSLGVDAESKLFKGYGHCVFLTGWMMQATHEALAAFEAACKKMGMF